MFHRSLKNLAFLSLVVGSAAYGSTACSGKKNTELVVAVQTDLRVPKDLNAVTIRVLSFGAVQHEDTYVVGPAGLKLPATMGIVPQDPESLRPIDIEIIGLYDTDTKVIRKARMTFAKDRVGLVRLPIKFSCYDAPDCPGEETCIAGVCAPIPLIEGSTLPEYTADQVFGAGAQSEGEIGECWDGDKCLAQSAPITSTSDPCVFSLATGDVVDSGPAQDGSTADDDAGVRADAVAPTTDAGGSGSGDGGLGSLCGATTCASTEQCCVDGADFRCLPVGQQCPKDAGAPPDSATPIDTSIADTAPAEAAVDAGSGFQFKRFEPGKPITLVIAKSGGTVGYCSGGVCRIALDQDPVEGWDFVDETRTTVKLAPGICQRVQSQGWRIEATDSCATKTVSLPLCDTSGSSVPAGDGGTNVGDGGVSCASGLTACPVDGRDRCVDMQTDPLNCGMCALTCNGGSQCIGGQCKTAAGEDASAGPDGSVCAWTCLSTGNECGFTRNPCTNSDVDCGTCSGGLTCEANRCVGGAPDGGTSCLPPREICGGLCVDTTKDDRNCGMCGLTCTGGQFCGGSVCLGGAPDGGSCTPMTCAQLPGKCGLVPDGCGGQMNCNCTGGQTCIVDTCMPSGADAGADAQVSMSCQPQGPGPLPNLLAAFDFDSAQLGYEKISAVNFSANGVTSTGSFSLTGCSGLASAGFGGTASISGSYPASTQSRGWLVVSLAAQGNPTQPADVAFVGSGSGIDGWFLGIDAAGTGVTFRAYVGGTTPTWVSSASAPFLTGFHQYVGVFRQPSTVTAGSTVTLYRDGVEVGSTVTHGENAPIKPGPDLFMGRNTAGTSFFNGNLGAVRIYGQPTPAP